MSRPSCKRPASKPFPSRTSPTSTSTRSSHTAGTSSPLDHPELGPGAYERNGFRIDGLAAGYDRSGPTLGQDNEWVLGEILGLSTAEQTRPREEGAFSYANSKKAA